MGRASFVCLLAVAALLAAPAVAGAARYYVSLGDSIAQGRDSYPEVLHAALERRDGRVQLERLGCEGATMSSLRFGGDSCRYASGSQYADARRFLTAHRGEVDLVTLAIGTNDLSQCIFDGSVICSEERFAKLRRDLSAVISGLRRAAGPDVVFAAMNMYNPFLGYYTVGDVDRPRRSSEVVGILNRALARTYRAAGVRVANVADAMDIGDFSESGFVAGIGKVPRNVELTCRYTLGCPLADRAFNPHLSAAGQRLVGKVFLRTALGIR